MMNEEEEHIEVRPEDRIALRRSLRADARLTLTGEPSGGYSPEGVVTDLSVHGLWVAVNRPLRLGDRLTISFRPAPAHRELALDAAVARVDWHEGSEGVMGMGLSFDGLAPDEQQVLEDALKGLPPRPSKATSPVIALVEHDPLEDEVEEILEDDDMVVIEESGVRAIPVADGEDEGFELIADEELEVFIA